MVTVYVPQVNTLRVDLEKRGKMLPDWKERLAIISDEAAPGFRAAVGICLPLGIRRFELRLLGGHRVPYVAEEALREVEEEVSRHDLKLIGLNPGFGKVTLEDPKAEGELGQGFDDAFRLMERLSITRMAMFSYTRTGPEAPIPGKVHDLLGRARERCLRQGYELLVENVPSVWGNTGTRLAEIARTAGLKVIWDPANSESSGEEAYPFGYRAVKPFIESVHLKNWDAERKYVYLNEGAADIRGQVRALVQDGYPGYFCIESHRWNDPEATGINAEQLLGYLEGTDSEG